MLPFIKMLFIKIFLEAKQGRNWFLCENLKENGQEGFLPITSRLIGKFDVMFSDSSVM